MKARYGLTLIFIAHDLAVVKNVSDRVAVMYLGKLCEVGAPDALYAQPAHPYTAALLAAIPVPDPDVAARRRAACSAARSRRRSTRRAAAGSAPAARRRRTRCADGGAADPRGRRPTSSWPATSRSSRASRSSSATGEHGAPRRDLRRLRRAGAPMEARDRIAATAGVGLDGDRYATGTGTYSGTGRGARDVTLIEREAVDAVRSTDDGGVDVREDETRRNLVTEGVALNHLVGRDVPHRRGADARRPSWPSRACTSSSSPDAPACGPRSCTAAVARRGPRRRRAPRRRRDRRDGVSALLTGTVVLGVLRRRVVDLLGREQHDGAHARRDHSHRRPTRSRPR